MTVKSVILIFDNDVELDSTDSENRSSLNSTLIEMDISPLKMHGIPQHSQISHGKKKIVQVKKKILHQEQNIQNQVASFCDVSPEQINRSKEEKDRNELVEEKAKDLDTLVSLMKQKLQISSRNTKIQILTMAPLSWSIEKIKTEFCVTSYMARTARRLAKEKGIFIFTAA